MEADCLKPVTFDDVDLIRAYLEKTNYEESNHNIVNMMIWLDFFKLEQWHNDDIMILICTFKDIIFAYMPLCTKDNFLLAIDKIAEIFQQLAKPMMLNCFTEEYVDLLYEQNRNYTFVEYPDINDYVYETEKLRTFSGKKLQKKRNNLNNFYKLYGSCYIYETIDKTNIEDCYDYLDDWRENLEDEFLLYEIQGIQDIFDNWSRLPVNGGLIRINGCVRAFIIGSELSRRMGQINVEKADENIRGLYQAILREFLLRNFNDKELLNREDDMGKPNLRQAKMAYNPLFMVKKYMTKG